MNKGFKIIGISVKTTNKGNQSSQDLAQLWERFYAENIFHKIPNKASNKVFSIYTDYKSNYTEDYTCIIGCSVKTLDNIPKDLEGREFLPENFKKFTAKGEMPKAVIDTWLNIWQKDSELNRKYTYDFEVYDEKSQNGENSEVEIYIAVK